MKREKINAITNITQLTPAWLTDLLHTNGHLEQGRVTHVETTGSGETLNAKYAHLAVRYSDNAITSAPTRLFFKHTKPDRVSEQVRFLNRKEATYYRVIADPIVFSATPCYGLTFLDDWDINLLLPDMSVTHQQWKDTSQYESIGPFEGMVDCLARLHAHWWEHQRLGRDVGVAWTDELLQTSLDRTAQRLDRFFDLAGDKVSPARREIYARIVQPGTWFKLWEGLLQDQSLTLCHNDVHLNNFLFPRDPHESQVILMDWQFYNVGVGAHELGRLLILYLPPERRAEWEKRLLERYYAHLFQGGVKRYPWEDFRRDYRLAAASNILTVVTYWANGVPIERVWPFLERAFAAFAELACEDFL